MTQLVIPMRSIIWPSGDGLLIFCGEGGVQCGVHQIHQPGVGELVDDVVDVVRDVTIELRAVIVTPWGLCRGCWVLLLGVFCGVLCCLRL